MKFSGMTILVANLVSVAVVGPSIARGQEAASSEPQYRVKAAFLYNFAKYIEWPEHAFERSDSAMIIGVLGSDPFDGELDRAVRGKVLNGHPLVVRPVASLAEIKRCHILFLSTSESKRIGEILNAVDGTSVLTVSETDAGTFLRAGGMINFLIEQNNVRFEINNESAKRVGLKISSRLLSLAKGPGH